MLLACLNLNALCRERGAIHGVAETEIDSLFQEVRRLSPALYGYIRDGLELLYEARSSELVDRTLENKLRELTAGKEGTEVARSADLFRQIMKESQFYLNQNDPVFLEKTFRTMGSDGLKARREELAPAVETTQVRPNFEDVSAKEVYGWLCELRNRDKGALVIDRTETGELCITSRPFAMGSYPKPVFPQMGQGPEFIEGDFPLWLDNLLARCDAASEWIVHSKKNENPPDLNEENLKRIQEIQDSVRQIRKALLQ